jgi:hypothetical protein
MDGNEFARVIKNVVAENSIRSVEEVVTDPPGRSPNKELLELSAWFKSLSENERGKAKLLISNSVDEAVFGFLSVLDGVRAIEGSGDKGRLLLYYVKGDERTLLNDETNEFLHDIYNSL